MGLLNDEMAKIMINKNRIILYITIISSACAAIFTFRQYIPTLFNENSSGGYYYSRQFDSTERWVNTNNSKEIGLIEILSPDGIEFKFRKPEDSRVIISTLWGIPSQNIEVRYSNIDAARLIFNANEPKKAEALTLKNKVGFSVEDLKSKLKGVNNFGITALKSGRGDKEALLRRIEVSVLPKDFIINLPLFLFVILLPVILFFVYETISNSPYRVLFFSVLSIFGIHLAMYYYGLFSSYYLTALSLITVASYFIFKYKVLSAKKVYSFIFLIILLIGISLRWDELLRAAFSIPHPDVTSGDRGYRFIADNMSLFTHKGFFAATASHHEPFYPFVVKIFFWIFGSSDLHLRFVSLFFSCVAICLTYVVAKKLFQNQVVALLSSVLVSFNSFLIEQSALGLRTEWETCLFLLLFYCCYLKRNEFAIKVWLPATIIIASIWLLTRTLMAPLIFFIIAYSCFLKNTNRKRKVFYLTAILCISILPLLPYKLNIYKAYGDMFWDSNTYATEAANREFFDKPGFPKEKVSTPEYFMQMHSPKELLLFHAVGFAGIFNFLVEDLTNTIYQENHLIKSFARNGFGMIKKYPVMTLKVSFLIVFSLISLLVILFSNKYRVILFLLVLGTAHNAFGYGVTILKGPLIVTFHRQIAHALPFFAYIISYVAVLFMFKITNSSILKDEKLRLE